MESLNLTRDIVGRRYPTRRNYLSEVWVKEFLTVIDPRTAEEFAASKSKQIPNVFMPALRDGPFEVFDDLGIELKRLLHVSQEYEYLEPLMAQSWADSETTIMDLKEKSSKLGSIYIMDLQTRFTQNAKPCFNALMRVFVRR